MQLKMNIHLFKLVLYLRVNFNFEKYVFNYLIQKSKFFNELIIHLFSKIRIKSILKTVKKLFYLSPPSAIWTCSGCLFKVVILTGLKNPKSRFEEFKLTSWTFKSNLRFYIGSKIGYTNQGKIIKCHKSLLFVFSNL